MKRGIAYLDSSALVKLVTRERETGALRRYIHDRPTRASSALVRTELIRAIRHQGAPTMRRARVILGRLQLISLDEGLLEAGALLDPPTLRTLDAIHLATSLTIAEDLDAVVTYDVRLRSAAEALGLPTATPAWK